MKDSLAVSLERSDFHAVANQDSGPDRPSSLGVEGQMDVAVLGPGFLAHQRVARSSVEEDP